MNDPSRLRIETHQVDTAVIVEVGGDVDLDTASRVREAIAVALHEADGGACLVDLTDVTYLGSAGLSALLEAAREAEAHQEPLRVVVDANRPVIRPIQITGLDSVLDLYHSVDEAMAASSDG